MSDGKNIDLTYWLDDTTWFCISIVSPTLTDAQLLDAANVATLPLVRRLNEALESHKKMNGHHGPNTISLPGVKSSEVQNPFNQGGVVKRGMADPDPDRNQG